MTTYHDQWSAEGFDVSHGKPAWYFAFHRQGDRVEPRSEHPVSEVGQQIASVLRRLRELRKGDLVRQASPPKKSRSRRQGEVSVTELARSLGKGPRQFRDDLRRLGLLQNEIVVRDRGERPPLYLHTLRLKPSAVSQGIGRRLEPKTGWPYDVLTNLGQQWIMERLRPSAARTASPRQTTRDVIRAHLAKGWSQSEIARQTGLSRQLVSHHARKIAA